MRNVVIAHPEDIHAVPVAYRPDLVMLLTSLRRGMRPECLPGAKQLVNQPWMFGDLSGLWTAPFGSSVSYYDAWRIVWRDETDTIEVLGIGLRTGSEVYKTVRDRLYPPERKRRSHGDHTKAAAEYAASSRLRRSAPFY